MRRRTTLVAALAASLVSAAVALAGGPQDPTGDEEPLGARAGLKYVSESHDVGTGGTHSPPADATQIACGGHASPWHPVSGGVKIGGAPADNLIAVMRPRDLDAPFESPANADPDDWWDNTVRSVVGRRLTGYAVCSRRELRYESVTVPDSPTGERTAELSCDPNFALVGGGAFIATSESFINSAFPAGPGRWRVRIHDTVGGLGGMLVHAICRRAGGVTFAKRVRRGVPAGRTVTLTPVCPPARHVSGGGARISGAIADAHLAGFHPVDRSDPDAVPDDGWRVAARNDTGAAKTVRAYAICVQRG